MTVLYIRDIKKLPQKTDKNRFWRLTTAINSYRDLSKRKIACKLRFLYHLTFLGTIGKMCFKMLACSCYILSVQFGLTLYLLKRLFVWVRTVKAIFLLSSHLQCICFFLLLHTLVSGIPTVFSVRNLLHINYICMCFILRVLLGDLWNANYWWTML